MNKDSHIKSKNNIIDSYENVIKIEENTITDCCDIIEPIDIILLKIFYRLNDDIYYDRWEAKFSFPNYTNYVLKKHKVLL